MSDSRLRISDRQAKILSMIVHEYTKTAEPVGSKRLVEMFHDKISSATVRNECAFLESVGLLEKQHTSSGRVPSSEGYRYYVDNLMDDEEFDKQLFDAIDGVFAQRNKSIEEIIDESSKIISDMTSLTAVVSTKDNFDQVKIKRMELIKLSPTSASIVFILSSGDIINKVYYLNEDQMNDLKIAIDMFNEKLTDTSISEMVGKKDEVEAELKSVLKDADSLFKNFVNAALKSATIKKSTYGIKNMLMNPEFNTADALRQVLRVVDTISPFEWFDYNHQNEKQKAIITTKIGKEIGAEGSEDLAIISSEITFKNGKQNAITLVGPKRMKYDEASVLLEFLIDKINKLINN